MIESGHAEQLRAGFARSQFARWMGLELLGVDDGTSEIRLTVEEHHLNRGGIVHGGIVPALADAAIGLAHRTRLPPGKGHVTVHLSVNYFRPIRRGSVVAFGRAVHGGGRIGYGEADVVDEEGRLLARASSTFMLVDVTRD